MNVMIDAEGRIVISQLGYILRVLAAFVAGLGVAWALLDKTPR